MAFLILQTGVGSSGMGGRRGTESSGPFGRPAPSPVPPLGGDRIHSKTVLSGLCRRPRLISEGNASWAHGGGGGGGVWDVCSCASK